MLVPKTAGFGNKLVAQRGAYQAYEQISGPGDQPDLDALTEGKGAGAGRVLGLDFGLGSVAHI